MFTPVGIGIIVVVIVALTTLVYRKRERIKAWLRSWTMDEVEVEAGPAKAKFTRKDADEDKAPSSPRAGVSFGEGNDFSGAKVRDVAGRDLRRGGGAAAATPEGEAPGVDFGKDGKFRDAEIEDVAGRDSVEDD